MFLRKKAWILIFAVIYAVYCVGAKYVLTPQSAFATINLNYSGASKGLNPNKTRFNAADILNQEVLERAIEKGAFEGITPKELKNTLWLEALDVEPKVLDENTSEEKYKVGTVYRIHYTADEKTKNLNPEAVIQMVAYAYYDYFMDKYSDKRNLLRIPQEELDALENMDYLDMLNYFEMKSAELERYMIEYLSLNGKWQSQKRKRLLLLCVEK